MHTTVLKSELVDVCKLTAKSVTVDVTLGAGGHSRAIWQKMNQGRLVSLDADIAAIKNIVGSDWTKQSDSIWGLQVTKAEKEWTVVNANFADLKRILNQLQIKFINNLIADLGWEDSQLETVPGLSYSGEQKALLDMRYDRSQGATAADLLNHLDAQSLRYIFSNNADIYGKQLEQIVSKVVATRPLKTVEDLMQICGRTFAPQVFQALRIAVNQELSRLQLLLETSFDLLSKEGRLGVIAFHSGESRLVESFFDLKVKGAKARWLYPKKFIQPTVSELRENIRSRSAKLYAIEKN